MDLPQVVDSACSKGFNTALDDASASAALPLPPPLGQQLNSEASSNTVSLVRAGSASQGPLQNAIVDSYLEAIEIGHATDDRLAASGAGSLNNPGSPISMCNLH